MMAFNLIKNIKLQPCCVWNRVIEVQNRCVHTSNSHLARRDSYTSMGFHEPDRKGGYGHERPSKKEMIRQGLKEMRTEMARFRHEVRELLSQDRLLVEPGDRDMVWVFDSTKKSPNGDSYMSNPNDEATLRNPITSLNRPHNVEESGSMFEGWIVTTDSTHGEGYSSAQLVASPGGHATFKGVLSTEIPKDGIVQRSGYCNMAVTRPRKSFGRDGYFNWADYTHLVFRCRGDGRSYIIALGASGQYDITWNDMFTYVLYTRGGPHWQTYRVPFSKFLLSSKGIIQDKQCAIDTEKITSFGISVGDKINAPFKLEIDYIAVENDPTHTEEFAYEMYVVPNYYAGY